MEATQHKLVVIPNAPTRMGTERSADATQLKAEIDRQGYVIIRGAIPEHLLADLTAQVHELCDRPALDYQIEGVPVFGERIRRATGLVGKAPAMLDLLSLPLLGTVAEAVMFDSCNSVALSSTTGIEVFDHGDVPPQPMHRDEAGLPAFLPRYAYGPEYTYNFTIAGTDFTSENGGTLVIPGSHLWPRDRVPTTDDPVVSLTMEKGDVAVWVGSLYHAAGVNRTPSPRLAIILGFLANWLRTFEDHSSALDPGQVARLSPQARGFLNLSS